MYADKGLYDLSRRDLIDLDHYAEESGLSTDKKANFYNTYDFRPCLSFQNTGIIKQVFRKLIKLKIRTRKIK